MNELEIAIEVTRQKRDQKQVDVYEMFGHCRFPSNEEFHTIKAMVVDIMVIDAQLEALTECRNAIAANAKEQK